MSQFATKYRTNTCGELRGEDVPKPDPDNPDAEPPTFMLAGHVDRVVDEKTFLIRDRYGKTMVTIHHLALPYVHERFKKIVPEDVVQVSGELAARDEKDAALPTGEVLLKARKIEVLSGSADLPPGVMTEAEVPYEDRLTFRQLYLRRPDVQKRLAFRSKVVYEIREFFLAKSFLEIETPQLFWYDPVAIGGEIVPAGAGKAWRTPCGPVVLDQYLIAGQFDRFFQFTRITRRENNPTPWHAQESTGLDINMAYVDMPDFCAMVEGLMAHIWKTALGQDLKTPFRQIAYDEAMLKYGTDKPDVRFGLEIADLPEAATGKEVVRTIRVEQGAEKLKDHDLNEIVSDIPIDGAKVTWVRIQSDKLLEGSAASMFTETRFHASKTRTELLAAAKAAVGDVVVVSTGTSADAAALGAGIARVRLGRKLGLIDDKKYEFVWVHSYPYLEPDKNLAGNLVARVVVFSKPLDEDRGIIAEEGKRAQVRAKAFDLILDGVELASAYIGNENLIAQKVIWINIFGLGNADLFRLRAPVEAHRFGMQPHGGMNVGVERLIATMLRLGAIDEAMFYPKDQRCRDLMLDAPGPVPPEAVADLVKEALTKHAYTEKDLAAEADAL